MEFRTDTENHRPPSTVSFPRRKSNILADNDLGDSRFKDIST